MTDEEKADYQAQAASLILAAMCTARGYKLPPPPVPDEASDERKAERAKERAEFERRQSLERMHLAAEAFQLAGALVAEAELWSGPQDEDGTPLDSRAFDRECLHGRKLAEPCADCDADAAQRRATGEGGETGKTE